MSAHHTSRRLAYLATGALLLLSMSTSRLAVADNPTPTVVDATLAVPTNLPSPEPTPTNLPTVVKERSTPISTVALPPVPTPSATPNGVSGNAQSNPQATSTAAPAQQPNLPASQPFPSPADLRTNARLRWGTRVPNAVRRWAFVIVPAAHKYGLSPNLVAAVMTMESGGDPLAWNSGSDARGLMQVLHGPWDPRANVFTGTRMLSEFHGQFHDLSLTLAAYNAGPNAVLQYGGVPPYRETHDYVIVVSYLYDLYTHHRLTAKRKALYRSTLKDLRHFPRQRQKVKRLAKIGHLDVQSRLDTVCRHSPEACPSTATHLFPTLDPFWPLAGSPDPLQQVDPARTP